VRAYDQIPPDVSRIIMEYRDAGGVLDVFDSGDISAVSEWQLVSDSRTAPVGTRSIDIRLISTRNAGTNNDGYYDALSLVAQTLLSIFPPSGTLATTFGFDLGLIVDAPGFSVVGAEAILDGEDVTAALAACVKGFVGTLPSGGETFRCPGLSGGTIGPGTHTLEVCLDLSDGPRVCDTVIWQVLENSEP